MSPVILGLGDVIAFKQKIQNCKNNYSFEDFFEK